MRAIYRAQHEITKAVVAVNVLSARGAGCLENPVSDISTAPEERHIAIHMTSPLEPIEMLIFTIGEDWCRLRSRSVLLSALIPPQKSDLLV
jgi:hypothetical protein